MVSKLRKVFTFWLVFILVFVMVGCTKVESLEIIGNSSVRVNNNITLQVIISPEEEKNAKIKWTSSDEAIASVVDGVVTGKGVGEVTIYASVGRVKATHAITVLSAEVKKNIFAGINLETVEVKVNEPVEFSLIERIGGYIRDHYNPYNYNELNVYGVFTSPSNTEIKMPAYWYRDYEIVLDPNYKNTSGISGVASTNPDEPQGLESVRWLNDNYHYRLKMQPTEAGKWNCKVYVEEYGVIAQIISNNFIVEESDKEYKGLIQVDQSNKRGFVYEDGSTFMPVGINLSWWTSSSRKTYDYLVWMENMSAHNMNIARIWMATWGFALHWGERFDHFDDRLNSAARLDRVLEIAKENDVYIMLTLINHGQFSSTANPLWSNNPYNVINGGILEKPEHFFTNHQAREVYKNELLYIIGRYGYSNHIMAWELWNEVNWTDNADVNALNIHMWHKEMAEFIKANDPYNHMVTTSYNYEDGSAYSLNAIDFANPHNYNYNNKNINYALPPVQEKLFQRYNKPILHSEIGINWQSGRQTADLDPNGVTLRQAAWAGMMGGGAGGAMHWWWDSWVHPRDLYYQFEGAGKYAKLMDLTGEDYSQLRLLNNVTLSSSSLGILGYKFNNRIYGYVYDLNWGYWANPSPQTNRSVTMEFTNGNYQLTIYHATTGEVLETKSVNVENNLINVILPTFTGDIAFIIK